MRRRDGTYDTMDVGMVMNVSEDWWAFDELGAMNPCVVRKKDGTYVMAYEGVNGVGRRSVGLAESTDGLREWRRVGEGPVLEASDRVALLRGKNGNTVKLTVILDGKGR